MLRENTQNQRPGKCRFFPFFFFFLRQMDYDVRWSFFFSEFRKRRFRKKKSRAKIFGKGFKGFFPLLGWDFRQPKHPRFCLLMLFLVTHTFVTQAKLGFFIGNFCCFFFGERSDCLKIWSFSGFKVVFLLPQLGEDSTVSLRVVGCF